MSNPRLLGTLLLAGGLVAAVGYQLRPEADFPTTGLESKQPRIRAKEYAELKRGEIHEEGHAWEAAEWWYTMRAYPNELIPKAAFFTAFEASKALAPPAGPRSSTWQPIGPDNVGGRVLALAIDPNNPTILWAGAASGGLWKSTTGGEGAAAWQRVETGYPSISVSGIVIDPLDSLNLYLGTGEISRYGRGLVGTPGARTSYGLGVLRSTDGGVSWQTTGLDWTFDQNRAVIALKMDPSSPSTLWAATSEGLYKSTDSGVNWVLKHNVLMCMDVVIDSRNGNIVFASHGQLNTSPDPGIYRSTDGGDSWTLLAGGLPTVDFGRTPLAIYSPAAGGPNILWAGVSNAVSRQVVGLYKSTNDGTTWTRINTTNWASSQAWYNNVVSVSPASPNTVLCGGLDAYRSTNGGTTLSQVSFWYEGYDGVIPAGGEEGPSWYVHADEHAHVWSPLDFNTVYIGCDGGIFKSTDGGVNWSGKNGGFQTTQFYAGFGIGTTTTALCLGGLQDNGTVKYTGSPSWSKVFGGDGGYCAIASNNENVLYEEYVYLTISKSTNGGQSWSEIYASNSTEANFIAPFVLSESNPSILYAGTRGMLKSTNAGASFAYTDGNSNWNGTPMASIGVSPTNPNHVIGATGSGTTGAVFEVRSSTNGGTSWTNVTAQLPNRFMTDATYDRNNAQNVWATFGGYGSPHVYRSTDAGATWTDQSGNLPDIPVQSVAIDPLDPNWIYVGTDLGNFATLDGGTTWTTFNDGMPIAMVIDLVIKTDNRKMRAATFGNGVYEVDLPVVSDVADLNPSSDITTLTAGPNPFRDATTIRFRLRDAALGQVEIVDAGGRRVRTLATGQLAAGEAQLRWDGHDDAGHASPTGIYFARIRAGRDTRITKVTLSR